MSQGENVDLTDVKHLYANDVNILAYRIGILETDIKGIDNKLDSFISLYPSSEMLALILKPLQTDVDELKAKQADEAKEKVKAQQQVKMLALGALIGPLGTFIITIVMANVLGVV